MSYDLVTLSSGEQFLVEISGALARGIKDFEIVRKNCERIARIALSEMDGLEFERGEVMLQQLTAALLGITITDNLIIKEVTYLG
jgi:hypothetical protein